MVTSRYSTSPRFQIPLFQRYQMPLHMPKMVPFFLECSEAWLMPLSLRIYYRASLALWKMAWAEIYLSLFSCRVFLNVSRGRRLQVFHWGVLVISWRFPWWLNRVWMLRKSGLWRHIFSNKVSIPFWGTRFAWPVNWRLNTQSPVTHPLSVTLRSSPLGRGSFRWTRVELNCFVPSPACETGPPTFSNV